MAVSEDEDITSSQGNSPSRADAGDAASGGDNGALAGRHPIASSDYCAGELSQNMDTSSPNTQALLGAIGERVTSVTGSQPLDPISSATVMRTVSRLDTWPRRDVHSDDTAEYSTPNLIVSTETALVGETFQADSVTYSDMSNFSSVPPLSVSSPINDDSNLDTEVSGAREDNTQTPEHMDLQSCPESNSESPVTCHKYQKSAERSDLSECSGLEKSASSVEDSTAKCFGDSKLPVKHFSERAEITDPQLGSSGYESSGTTTSFSNENGKQCQRPEGALSENTESACNNPVNDSALQISETGINAIKSTAGTQTSPIYPEYSRLSSRLTSFASGFHLGDGVEVNRDLLALAGFYYSGWDTVTCYHCGCSPRVWGDGRYPETEHRMLAPYCKAVVHQ